MPYDTIVERGDMGGMIPVEYRGPIIEGAIAQSAVLSMASREPDMPMKTRVIPVLASNPTAYFVDGDAGLKQTSEATWTGLTLTAEELAVIVPIPKAALDDSAYPLWEQIRPKCVEAIGAAIDSAVFFGTNKPASWPTAILTAAVAASNSVTLGTGADLYEDLLDENGVVSLVELDGYMCTGHVAHLGMRGKLRGVRDADGGLIFLPSMQEGGDYRLDGQPIQFPRNGSMVSTSAWLFSGDWTMLKYAIRQDLEYLIADQAVITDAAGTVILNLFQQDLVALRIVIRLGVQIGNPVNRINPTTQYPFAVLIP